MRHNRFLLCALSVVMLAVSSTLSFADVSDIVTNFNSKNGGKGFLFRAVIDKSGSSGYFKDHSPGVSTGEFRLYNEGTASIDLSGYSGLTSYNGGANINASYFQTFCVDPGLEMSFGVENSGLLNYGGRNVAPFGDGTTRTKMGARLNLGVAYLYKEFAAGTLRGYEYTYGDTRIDTAVILQDTIWLLMGRQDKMVNSANANWSTNDFLQELLRVNNSQSYWVNSIYDLNATYGFMDDYKVFVMNVTTSMIMQLSGDSTSLQQDVLYVIRDGGGNGVPEPASLLLWTLGSIGVAGVAYRKRRMKSA